MTITRHLSVEFALHWRSAQAEHCDRRHFERLSTWRDFFPRDLGERLNAAAAGERVAMAFAPGELVPLYDQGLVQRLPRGRFRESPRPGLKVIPRAGRLYPATFFDTPLFFHGDYRPSRILAVDADGLEVDFNHPPARYGGRLEARVVADLGSAAERGGRCSDVAQEVAARGPGMQAAPPGGP